MFVHVVHAMHMHYKRAKTDGLDTVAQKIDKSRIRFLGWGSQIYLSLKKRFDY